MPHVFGVCADGFRQLILGQTMAEPNIKMEQKIEKMP